jgi:hypothetical protein
MIDDINDYLGGCEGKNMLIAVAVAIIVAVCIYIFYIRKTYKETIMAKPVLRTELLTPMPSYLYLEKEKYIPASGGNFNPDKGSYGAREAFIMNDGRDVNSADLFMQVYDNLAPQKF